MDKSEFQVSCEISSILVGLARSGFAAEMVEGYQISALAGAYAKDVKGLIESLCADPELARARASESIACGPFAQDLVEEATRAILDLKQEWGGLPAPGCFNTVASFVAKQAEALRERKDIWLTAEEHAECVRGARAKLISG